MTRPCAVRLKPSIASCAAATTDMPDSMSTIAAATMPSPLDGRVLHLDDALFAHDALVWDELVSQSVRYGADAGPQLEIAFPDTPMLGIWTKPGAAFVCVEPWTCPGDALNSGDRLISLAPGEARALWLEIACERSPATAAL